MNALMTLVWESGLKKATKMVAMAYAEHGDGMGFGICLTIEDVCRVTGYSRRSVQVITSRLVGLGILIPDGEGPKGENCFCLCADKLPNKQPYVEIGAYPIPGDRRCAYCGLPPTTRDHVMPRSRGGSDDSSNLVWACNRCNARKNNRTPEEAGMPIVYIEESRVLP